MQRVQTIYEPFGREDVPAILGHMDEDVSWEDGAKDHVVPWLTPGRGRAQVAAFFEAILAFDMTRFERRAFLEGEDCVAAVIG